MTDKKLGLYFHIPFCLKKCGYCDFYSGCGSTALQENYVAALCRHVALTAPEAADFTVHTVYFGGGTPTVLPPLAIAKVLAAVRQHFRVGEDAEITVECNPATETGGLFEGLRSAGVNRLSVGLQSADERELKALGRPHSFADFLHTVRGAKAAGFTNISVDVMFGIPHQTKESLARTLAAVLKEAPTHISAYGLRIEEGTPFFEKQAGLPLPDDDTVADMQLQIAKALARAGYTHYEVSNYAKDGYRSRHNMGYWQGLDYLGFGAAAHSYFKGERFACVADRERYAAAATAEDFGRLVTDRQRIGAHEAREEYVMLRMRLFEGIDLADFERRFGAPFEACYGDVTRLIEGGFLTRKGGRLAFTERGMYVSNAILSEWLNFDEG